MKVLRALTNTSFGHSKEDIARIYKLYIRPILSYADPAGHFYRNYKSHRLHQNSTHVLPTQGNISLTTNTTHENEKHVHLHFNWYTQHTPYTSSEMLRHANRENVHHTPQQPSCIQPNFTHPPPIPDAFRLSLRQFFLISMSKLIYYLLF